MSLQVSANKACCYGEGGGLAVVRLWEVVMTISGAWHDLWPAISTCKEEFMGSFVYVTSFLVNYRVGMFLFFPHLSSSTSYNSDLFDFDLNVRVYEFCLAGARFGRWSEVFVPRCFHSWDFSWYRSCNKD